MSWNRGDGMELPEAATIDHVKFTISAKWADGSEEMRVYPTQQAFEAAYIALVGHPPIAKEKWSA